MVPENDNHTAGTGGPSEYTIVEEDLDTNLDPELQDIVITQRQVSLPQDADPPPAGGSRDSIDFGGSGPDAGRDEVPLIDVIAKLNDPDNLVNGLTIAQRIGQIVTGTVRADEVERVRAHPNVISLKAARKLQKNLGRSVKEIQATGKQLRDALPASLGNINGSGVVVGIIDRGCDFAHPNFLQEGKKTRIKFLWDQHGDASALSPPDFPYGREFKSQDLDDALAAGTRKEAYERLRYDPGLVAHGTYVMDIAAGSGGANNPPGVAPGADIIFVDLFADDFDVYESYGNSRHLLEAVKYVFERAGTQPAVVNLSLNVNGGPHDGSSLVEQGIDTLLRERQGRAVVIAAGNSRLDNHHITRQLQPGQPTQLLWEIPKSDKTNNMLDLWYKGTEVLEIFLFTPLNERLGPFPLKKTITIERQGQPAGRVYHRKKDPNNGDNQIVLQFGPRMEEGTWRIGLRPLGTQPVGIHAWIEIDPGMNSTFKGVLPTDTACTIGSLACGELAIAVSAYDPDAAAKLPHLTAEGPTRNNQSKPEVSAPGYGIRAARSLRDDTRQGGGTSAAAPHVTGLIALLIQASGQTLSIEQIRDAVMNNARNDPPPGSSWDSCFGIGRVNAAAAILAQVNHAPLVLNVAAASSMTTGADIKAPSPLNTSPAHPLGSTED
jgi:subtilisin family serine protease